MPSVSGESTDYHQILDTDGTVRDDASVPEIPDDELVEMYWEMRLARHFDERTISLHRQGRMGTYTPMAGQEGAQIGSAHALEPEDWFIPSYREHAAKMALGMDPREILLYWKGNEVGNEIAEDLNIFPVAITVGVHLPHATGLAWASKLKGEQRAFLCDFGDGATSQGDFHEALNFAGVFDVPAIFFCNNNQWAISVSGGRQTAAETYAQKASAYGFEGVRVDGMDPLAVHDVTNAAVGKAKGPDEGELRPTLIEAVMYRFGPHTTADDPTVYRDEEELPRWKEKDPIPRLGRFLRDRGLLDDEVDDAIQTGIEDTVARAIEEAEAYESDPESMLGDVYAAKTPRLEAQTEYLREFRERHGEKLLTD
jgi:pyruvate dehydrogenase E1 component alpha subunit